MIVGPVQRECICDPWMRRHGEHGPECAKAYKAKLLGRKDDVRALHAEGHHLVPECRRCAGNKVVTVPVGPRDEFGCQHTEEAPCPACSEGAVAWRGHFDVLSRTALAPAPVTAADFLPNPPSSRSESALGSPIDSLCGDSGADAEGCPAPEVDLNAGQAPCLAAHRSERDAHPVAAVPAVPGPGTALSPSLMPARSLPGAQASTTSEDPASASPGRRSNLQGRAA